MSREEVPRIWEGEGSRRSEILNPINNDYWVGSYDDKARLYSLGSPGKPALAATLDETTDYADSAAFSGDGARLATGPWDGKARLSDAICNVHSTGCRMVVLTSTSASNDHSKASIIDALVVASWSLRSCG